MNADGRGSALQVRSRRDGVRGQRGERDTLATSPDFLWNSRSVNAERPTPNAERPDAESKIAVLGDVVISVETAARQADTHGISLDEELELLITHGVLHLLGYEDETEAGMLEMEAKERALGVRP